MEHSFGREPVFSPTLTDTNEITYDERAKGGDAQRAAATLLHTGAVNAGQHRRIVGALQSSSSRVPWLTGLLVRAATDAGRRDITGVLREITGTLAEITTDLEVGQVDTETADYTSQGLCDQIPPDERHHYPYCSEAGSDLSREIVDMIRMLGSGQNKVAIDRSLRKRGYSRFELKNAAGEFVTNVRRVFKTGSLFSTEASNHDTSVVHETINELLQNTDFVHHMMQLMAMHLPPDYQWRSDQIAHVCRWWIMHYISLVRPQLVHAVIECPNDSAMSCRLTGLGVNGGAPVAKWHGSSSVVFKKSNTTTPYTAHLQNNGRYLQSFLRYQAHTKLLMESSPSSVFAKLTPQQRIEARKSVNEATKAWRAAITKIKQTYYLVPGYTPNSHLDFAPSGVLAAVFEDDTQPTEPRGYEIKYLRGVAGVPDISGLLALLAKYPTDVSAGSNPGPFKELAVLPPKADATEKNNNRELRDPVVWWVIKLNPVLLDNPQYLFEIIDGVQYKSKQLNTSFLRLGNLFDYTKEEILYELKSEHYDVVEQFQASARRVASRVAMVCSKAHRALMSGSALKVDPTSAHSAHSTAAGLKLLLFLAAKQGGPVDIYTDKISAFYSEMRANGIQLDDTAVPSNVQTKPEFDSIYATTADEDSTQPTDSMSTEQWISKLENAFDTSA